MVPWAEVTGSFITASETDALYLAVTAAAGTATTVDPSLFENPGLNRITPITVTDDGRVFGHVATHDVCHVGMPGVCTTAPVDDDGYRMFHRYQPDGVPVSVGRITAGGGKFRCTCRQCRGSNDDHACLKSSLGATIAHHDRLSTVAWVRAGEDTRLNAVWVSGIVNPGATIDDLAALSRQKVSGDWRPVGVDARLVEILALSREEPGFPLPHFRIAAGQVSALTAAGVVRPAVGESDDEMSIDYERLADLLAGRLADRLRTDVQPGGVDTAVMAADTTAPVGADGDSEGLLGEVDDAVRAGRAIRLQAELDEVF